VAGWSGVAGVAVLAFGELSPFATAARVACLVWLLLAAHQSAFRDPSRSAVPTRRVSGHGAGSECLGEAAGGSGALVRRVVVDDPAARGGVHDDGPPRPDPGPPHH